MCDVCAVVGIKDAAPLVLKGLHGGQNRASEFAGIASSDGINMYRHAAPGLAREVFGKSILARLHGDSALGHLRYATSGEGEANRDNTQPIMGNWKGTPFAVSHNGNLTNTARLAREFPTRATTMDTEYIVRLIEASAADNARPGILGNGEAKNIEWAVLEAVSILEGSFALGILLADGRLIAVQCAANNHPLSIGRIGSGFALSSETTGLTAMGAEFLEDVKPGTMVVMHEGNIKRHVFKEPHEKKCAFEHVYLSMPTSRTFGHSVSEFRRRVGVALEESCPSPGADIVVGVPDSANLYAIGYGESKRSGTYHPSAILRHHEASRNFLLDTQENRTDDIALKHLFDAQAIEGKSVVVIDDSIVRGTTSRRLMGVLRQLKAREIHVRIACPPIRNPCVYGVNTKTHSELIANQLEKEDLRIYLHADSLEFLPMEIFKNLLPGEDPAEKHCFACWTGKYWHPTAW